jgi:hypothetical protein
VPDPIIEARFIESLWRLIAREVDRDRGLHAPPLRVSRAVVSRKIIRSSPRWISFRPAAFDISAQIEGLPGKGRGPQSVFRQLFDVIDDDLLGGHFGLVQTQAELFAQRIEDSGQR